MYVRLYCDDVRCVVMHYFQHDAFVQERGDVERYCRLDQRSVAREVVWSHVEYSERFEVRWRLTAYRVRLVPV